MKKKVLALIMAFALVASLTACGGTTDNTGSKSSNASTTSTVEKDKDTTDKTDKKETDSSKADDKKDDKSSASDKSNKETSSSKSDNKTSSSTSSSKTSSSGSSSKPSGDSGSSSSTKPSTGGGSSSSGNNSSSKPSTGDGSSSSGNSGSSSKPSTGGGSSSSGNSGNSGSTNKPHQHNYNTVVSSTNGDCSHKGKVTKKCSCGATITVDGNYGSHNWKDSYKEVYHEAVTKPVYDYCYICNECGIQLNDENDMIYHVATVCGGGYSYKEWVDHYETVTPAWTERVPNGKDCTICGKHSN